MVAVVLRAVKAGQEEVRNKLPKVGERGSGSHRKHQSSPAYVRLAQEMGMALGHKGERRVSWLIARRLQLEEMEGIGE